jgi:mannitol-1-phosphate/altronate dehydrogenase
VPSVVHLSVGHFHRSHQAAYLDALARRGHTRVGVVGVALRRRATADALRAQDGLYTLVERDGDGDHPRVIGVMQDCLYAPDDPRAVVAALADPRTRLATLTVTLAGYAPQRGSALGFLIEALDHRRQAGHEPFAVLSCDNLADNGAVARDAVVALAEHRDPRLARWIAERVAFPSSMVDRITPTTTAEDRARVERDFGVRDRCPVMTEPFTQWVVEDDFGADRPPLDEVGVEFVPDVRPYALVKTRLLNAIHSAIGHLGSVVGHRDTVEAMADPVLRAYVTRLMDDEIAPLLPLVPGMHGVAFRRTLMRRLANPQMPDRLDRLARNGSSKVPSHLLTSLLEAREHGRDHPLLTLAIAGWCRHLRGVDERGRPLIVTDLHADRLRPLALATDPRALLRETAIFGAIGRDESFARELEHTLTSLARDGVRATLARHLSSERPVAA